MAGVAGAMRFADKRVFVSGAASGIGRAVALAFAAEGARVLVADLNDSGLEETIGLAGADGERMIARHFDASSRQQCFAMVEQCVNAFDGLDVQCNIAGFAQSRHFTDYTEDDWQRMLSVNLSGVFYSCQAAIPELLASGGNIVNMASSAGLVGQAYQASYCATKGGVVMLSKALAMEYTKQGIRVNSVCPGGVNTPLAANFEIPQEADMKLVERLFPLVDSAEPEEIAALVLYLASDQARFVSGVALPIDGAQTAG